MRYTRRRRAAACFNGEQYERSEFRKTCPCVEEDYECDFGYERSTEGGPCVAVMAIATGPPKECAGYYNVSNGYRLVSGDTCDPAKGIDRLPTVKRCPGLFSGAAAEVSSSGWGVLFVLLLLLCVLGAITMRHRSEHSGLDIGEILSNLPMDKTSLLICLFSIPGALVEGFTWLKNTATGFRGGPGPQYGRVPDSAMDDELDLGGALSSDRAATQRRLALLAPSIPQCPPHCAPTSPSRMPRLSAHLPPSLSRCRATRVPDRRRCLPHAPPSAEDDELIDEEAEELDDDDALLSSLPTQTPPRPTSDVGSLLGEEFTSPQALKKGD